MIQSYTCFQIMTFDDSGGITRGIYFFTPVYTPLYSYGIMASPAVYTIVHHYIHRYTVVEYYTVIHHYEIMEYYTCIHRFAWHGHTPSYSYGKLCTDTSNRSWPLQIPKPSRCPLGGLCPANFLRHCLYPEPWTPNSTFSASSSTGQGKIAHSLSSRAPMWLGNIRLDLI